MASLAGTDNSPGCMMTLSTLICTCQRQPGFVPNTCQTWLCRHMRDVVGQCLQKEPEKRPSAAQLLQHKFFTKHGKDKAFLVKALKLSSPGKPLALAVPTPMMGSPAVAISAGIFHVSALALLKRIRALWCSLAPHATVRPQRHSAKIMCMSIASGHAFSRGLVLH